MVRILQRRNTYMCIRVIIIASFLRQHHLIRRQKAYSHAAEDVCHYSFLVHCVQLPEGLYIAACCQDDLVGSARVVCYKVSNVVDAIAVDDINAGALSLMFSDFGSADSR